MDATTLTVTAGAALVGFLTAALLGKVLIPVLHRLKFGQTIREEGPAWHRAKQGTPTMGGVLFIIGSLAAALLGMNERSLLDDWQTFGLCWGAGFPAPASRCSSAC